LVGAGLPGGFSPRPSDVPAEDASTAITVADRTSEAKIPLLPPLVRATSPHAPMKRRPASGAPPREVLEVLETVTDFHRPREGSSLV